MDKARVFLIRPNSSIETTPPPLGLMYVASYLRKNLDNCDIKILDARIKDMSPDEVAQSIKEYNPQYVGITSLHADSVQMHLIARLTKNTIKDCKVIAGGPYPTGDYLNVLKDENVDFCVIGEGEVSFYELMRAFLNKANLDIKGVAFRKNGSVFYAGPHDYVERLDDLPFPAWDMISLNDYFYGKKRSMENPVQTYKRAVPVLSSRGCPFGCIYCHNVFGKRFRGRSPENVVAEIKYLVKECGVQEMEFLDDTFNFDKERAKKICDLMVKENVAMPICFSNGLRADRMDEELILKLKQAGTYRINYGIESASERIQKIIGKSLNLSYAKGIIEKTYKHKILSGGFFMLGFPSETEEEAAMTIDFAANSKLHTAVFSIVTPFPGTKLYELAKASTGAQFSTVGKVSVNMSAIENKKLEQLRIKAYRRFYFNPLRWLRIFIRVPRKMSLVKNCIEVIRVSFFKKELYG